ARDTPERNRKDGQKHHDPLADALGHGSPTSAGSRHRPLDGRPHRGVPGRTLCRDYLQARLAATYLHPASGRRVAAFWYIPALANHSVAPNHPKMPNETLTSHSADIDATVAAFTRLMDRMAAEHQPPADAGISMSQLRCLHLIAGAGPLRMS